MIDYRELAVQLKSLIEDDEWDITVLSNAAAFIREAMDDINWSGFYLMRDGVLRLGPFQGKTACTVIRPGRGVCGASAEADETILVKDVHEFPGHIACDSASMSEIVIPIHAGGTIYGLLDIDSPVRGRFTESDRMGLEGLAHIIEDKISSFF